MKLTSAVSPTEAPLAKPRPKLSMRNRINKVMKVVRRIHLYSGLFMTPWVFLYGVSALLFNHPDAFPDGEVKTLAAGFGGEKLLAEMPRAGALAERVVAGLNQQRQARIKTAPATATSDAGTAEVPPYRLVQPESAAFNRDFSALARGDGKDYIVRLNMTDGSGSARENVKRPVVKPAPFVSKGGVKLDPLPFEPVLRDLPSALKASGVEVNQASVRLAPDLSFLMEADGQVWRVTYNAQTGLVTGKPADKINPSPSFRRYLILLHVAHGFPSLVNVRWVWAIIVDLMFVSMVGWGFTGLLMWFQMKNVRTIGIVVLVFSLITALVLAVGMHDIFVAEGLS